MAKSAKNLCVYHTPRLASSLKKKIRPLPLDILLRIFECFDTRDDTLHSLRLVSRCFNQLVTPLFYANFTLTRRQYEEQDVLVPHTPGGQLTQERLDMRKPKFEDVTQKILQHTQTLRDLYILFNSGYYPADGQFKRLKALM